ncbi:skin secretory protein xP2-like isoform X2 [Panicum virgatum]|uniref:skin secretory protein xP2-like isoform X2 n=1 Tax=Panicum virgatum TaxID=38727 RepID=UPI0019D654A8|nr:skin secretory protein xP2-like isoform X2 [Panicum virgatum]
MAGGSRPGGEAPRQRQRQRALLVALVALCSLLTRPQPSRAFFLGGVRSGAPRGGREREEKVPVAVVVPDLAPRPAPLGVGGPSPSAAPAPAPVPGSDGGDEDGTPRLPSERRSPRGAPSSGERSAAAQAPAGAASANFISSSPAVPLPAGVTDSATVLPMPTPGHQRRVDVGMGALRLQVRAVQLAVPLLMMMLSFRALWW